MSSDSADIPQVDGNSLLRALTATVAQLSQEPVSLEPISPEPILTIPAPAIAGAHLPPKPDIPTAPKYLRSVGLSEEEDGTWGGLSGCTAWEARRRAVITHFPSDISSEALQSYFNVFGTVVSVRIFPIARHLPSRYNGYCISQCALIDFAVPAGLESLMKYAEDMASCLPVSYIPNTHRVSMLSPRADEDTKGQSLSSWDGSLFVARVEEGRMLPLDWIKAVGTTASLPSMPTPPSGSETRSIHPLPLKPPEVAQSSGRGWITTIEAMPLSKTQTTRRRTSLNRPARSISAPSRISHTADRAECADPKAPKIAASALSIVARASADAAVTTTPCDEDTEPMQPQALCDRTAEVNKLSGFRSPVELGMHDSVTRLAGEMARVPAVVEATHAAAAVCGLSQATTDAALADITAVDQPVDHSRSKVLQPCPQLSSEGQKAVSAEIHQYSALAQREEDSPSEPQADGIRAEAPTAPDADEQAPHALATYFGAHPSGQYAQLETVDTSILIKDPASDPAAGKLAVPSPASPRDFWKHFTSPTPLAQKRGGDDVSVGRLSMDDHRSKRSRATSTSSVHSHKRSGGMHREEARFPHGYRLMPRVSKRDREEEGLPYDDEDRRSKQVRSKKAHQSASRTATFFPPTRSRKHRDYLASPARQVSSHDDERNIVLERWTKHCIIRHPAGSISTGAVAEKTEKTASAVASEGPNGPPTPSVKSSGRSTSRTDARMSPRTQLRRTALRHPPPVSSSSPVRPAVTSSRNDIPDVPTSGDSSSAAVLGFLSQLTPSDVALGRSIVVRNVLKAATAEHLSAYFAQYGPVESCRVLTAPHQTDGFQSIGRYAVVTFVSHFSLRVMSKHFTPHLGTQATGSLPEVKGLGTIAKTIDHLRSRAEVEARNVFRAWNAQWLSIAVVEDIKEIVPSQWLGAGARQKPQTKNAPAQGPMSTAEESRLESEWKGLVPKGTWTRQIAAPPLPPRRLTPHPSAIDGAMALPAAAHRRSNDLPAPRPQTTSRLATLRSSSETSGPTTSIAQRPAMPAAASSTSPTTPIVVHSPSTLQSSKASLLSRLSAWPAVALSFLADN